MHSGYPAVKALTIQGKILVAIVRFLCSLLRPFYGSKWKRPIAGFEENPLHYKGKDLLYFAYKYYFKPPELAETDKLVRKLHSQKFEFPVPSSKLTTISVGGDLMPYEVLNRTSCAHLWDHIGDWYFGSDIVFANLETPIALSKKPGLVPEVMLSNMYFNGNEELFEVFNGLGKYRGHDVLSTANNHSYDQGRIGVEETIHFLNSRKIAFSGTQTEKQKSIARIEKDGIRFAFVSATYCLNHLQLNKGDEHLVNTGDFNKPGVDLDPIKLLVEEARQGADIVLLSLHTGNAYQAYPSLHTTEIFKRIFETCEPDLILGSHPHNPQVPEQIEYFSKSANKNKKGFAIYSQGDFVAYDIFIWCHLHLGIKLFFGQTEEGPALCGFEALPHRMKKVKDTFIFVPLLDEQEMDGEQKELLRFWNKHLAPSLSSHVRH